MLLSETSAFLYSPLEYLPFTINLMPHYQLLRLHHFPILQGDEIRPTRIIHCEIGRLPTVTPLSIFFKRNHAQPTQQIITFPKFANSIFHQKTNINEVPTPRTIHGSLFTYHHLLSIWAKRNTMPRLRLRHRQSGTPLEAKTKGLQSPPR